MPTKNVTPVPAFAGKTVVCTGTFVTMKRAAAEKLLAEAGATIGGSVTKATNLLIYGDNAGSKLDKAAKQGVTLMTEVEMVALLTAGGAGAEQLAGASEKLAAKQGSASEMATVVAELRAWVVALQKRKDIHVERATFGRKAGKAKLAQLRAQGAPDDLIDLHAEVDGIHIVWRFVEPSGGGCMRIPEISQWSRYTDDDSHYMNFGDDQEAMLFDEITAEGNTWLVRDKPEGGEPAGKSRLRFASAAEGSDGICPANDIAEYLRSAMKNGMVHYWPRCFQKRRGVSYAEQEQAITRFQAAPVVPVKVVAGTRVEFAFFSEGGRGVALALHEVPESRATEFHGTKFVEVQADEGSVAMIATQWLKGITKQDAYEQIRASALTIDAAGLGPLLDDLARAINPLAHYSAGLPSNARRAAGLLANRTLPDAVEFVLALDQAVLEAKLDRRGDRSLIQDGQEFSPAELSRLGWNYTIAGLLEGLYAGLGIRCQHESVRTGVAGNELLDPQLVERLAATKGAESLVARCSTPAVLPAVQWHHDPNAAAELGLRADAVVWAGTGF